MKQTTTEGIEEQVNALHRRQKTLSLATINEDGSPSVSQTPFAMDEQGNFLILVSRLAAHGRNLDGADKIDVMLVQEENDAGNPYARKRVNYQCDAKKIERDSAGFKPAVEIIHQRFGNFIDTLVGLPDFTVYRLDPIEGLYVGGFGAAYRIRNGSIEQVGPENIDG